MEETYWALFRATGAPVFYLLYRESAERDEEPARIAWAGAEDRLL